MTSAFRSLDPATGETVWEGAAASREEVRAAVARGRAGLPGWAGMPLESRIAHVRAFQRVLEATKQSLAETIARETGKPRWEGLAEVSSMIGKVEISIAAQAERAGEKRSAMPFGEAVLRHRSHGVMAVLGPYNFPGHLPNGHIVPALLAGNAVVFKPSELTPAVGEAMALLWEEVGLPPGVFSMIQGGRETGAALVEADIDGLLFTGSAAAGAHFRRVLADRPQVIAALELGGNNPLILWDGDGAEAASIAVQSGFITTGQRCSCARRLIVPDDARGMTMVEAIAALADRVRIGAWNDEPAPFMGPLISDAAAEAARKRFDHLVDMGGKVIRSLLPVAARPPAFVTPAMIDMTGIDAPDEEIFAPVLQLYRVPHFDAAIAKANDTRYGLSAGLVTEDDTLWQSFLLESRAGVVNRNRPTTGAAGSMPFGGLGESGNHRPSAYYAADYCAYPVASFEAASADGNAQSISAMLTS